LIKIKVYHTLQHLIWPAIWSAAWLRQNIPVKYPGFFAINIKHKFIKQLKRTQVEIGKLTQHFIMVAG
jgi:hypothetical protein